jgi:hypothetical protein
LNRRDVTLVQTDVCLGRTEVRFRQRDVGLSRTEVRFGPGLRLSRQKAPGLTAEVVGFPTIRSVSAADGSSPDANRQAFALQRAAIPSRLDVC